MTSGNVTLLDSHRAENDHHRVRRRTRNRSRDRRQIYQVRDPRQFDIAKLVKPENLFAAYEELKERGGNGAGLDGLQFKDFSKSEIYGVLGLVSTVVKNRSYRPHPKREFTFEQRPGKDRTLLLQNLPDRTVDKALLICLTPLFKRVLPNYGRDVWRLYAQMERQMREQQAFVLAIDDIRNCFPSAIISDVMECFHQHISQPDLLWLIERIVKGHDDLKRKGLDQGSPFSPAAMDTLLHHCLDIALEARLTGLTSLLRYVDNLSFVCSSVREGEEVLRISNEILSEKQLCLKGEDGTPQDIRDPNYNRAVLGMIPRWLNGQLNLSIPESAYEDLRQGLSDANDCDRPPKAARWVSGGWINALGPAFTSASTSIVVDRVMDIAQSCGFREISRHHLTSIAQKARRRWIATLREEYR